MTAGQGWILERGDCLQVLTTIKSESMGAVITDPSYSSVGSASQCSSKTWYSGTQTAPDYEGDTRDAPSWALWASLWLSEARRCTRPGGLACVFTDWRMLPLLTHVVQSAGWIWRGVVPWNKGRGTRPRKGGFRSRCEYIVWASKGPISDDPGCYLDGLFDVPRRAAEKDWHQMAKPEQLLEQLVQVAPVGSCILDPFAGGATTGIAALRHGRTFHGIELSGPCHERGVQRLRQETRLLRRAG